MRIRTTTIVCWPLPLNSTESPLSFQIGNAFPVNIDTLYIQHRKYDSTYMCVYTYVHMIQLFINVYSYMYKYTYTCAHHLCVHVCNLHALYCVITTDLIQLC